MGRVLVESPGFLFAIGIIWESPKNVSSAVGFQAPRLGTAGD